LRWNRFVAYNRKGLDMQASSHGPVGALLCVLLLVVMGALAAFATLAFRVGPDELGIVLSLGRFVRQAPPGLHFRLPYPIEEVRLPKVTRQNVVQIRARPPLYARGLDIAIAGAEPRGEGMMITADENIVALDAAIFWRIASVQDYLFNVQDPDATVRDVAESAAREIVGRSEIRPLLTRGRRATEQEVRELMQRVLDGYAAGVHVDQVRLQRVDPPDQVIDAFRDVQAARTDAETFKNAAEAYRDRVIPEARGEAEGILQSARAYRERTIAEATGQAARALQILDGYKKAPDVTRQRIYLETMERVLGGASKVILDTKGVQGGAPAQPADRAKGSGKAGD
jgi:modulator of FtsH protease HflK